MSYVIMRVEKAKTLASVGSRAAHNLRASPLAAPHANPKRRVNNEVLTGPSTVPEVVAAVMEILANLKKFRKDAVRAVELVLSASPDFFKADAERTEADWSGWRDGSMEWLRDTWGAENVVLAVLHLDEETPHIQALVVPRHEGKLRAAHWLDGPAKLAKLQDSYANRFAGLRLRRGERGSKAKHVRLREFYRLTERVAAAVERATKTHRPPKLPELGPFGRVSAADWNRFQRDLAKYIAEGLELRKGAAAAELIASSAVGIEMARRKELATDGAAQAEAGLAKLKGEVDISRAVLVDLELIKDARQAEIGRLDAEIAGRRQALNLGQLEQYHDRLVGEIGDLQRQHRDLDRR